MSEYQALSTPAHKYGDVCCEPDVPRFQARRRVDALHRRESATPKTGASRRNVTVFMEGSTKEVGGE